MDKRISLVVHEDFHIELNKVALSDNRSLNFTLVSLLQKALKEKKRKRVKKQIHPADNSTNKC